MEKAEKNVKQVCIFSNNDVKETYDNTVLPWKVLWAIIVFLQLLSHQYLDVFLFWRGQVRTTRKFNTLKASKPEVVVETEDEMEFVIEEETVS
jgi:hypothetical protein